MHEFYNGFIHAFVSLFSIVNPIGMSSVFLSMTERYSIKKRNALAYNVAIDGALLLIATLLLGPYILTFFGISLSNIQVAGGMLVFYTAWMMFNTKPSINRDEVKEAQDNKPDIAFFPLTMPITAGAGSIAVTIALGTKNETHFYGYLGIILAILLVFVLVGLCYRYASIIFDKLGQTGSNVITRISSFILLAISTSIIWDGILGLIGNRFPTA